MIYDKSMRTLRRLSKVAGAIDNPWSVCQRRSAQVGRHLAEVLLQRQHGRRPVTLIGFSLGARVIYYCLKVYTHIFSYLLENRRLKLIGNLTLQHGCNSLYRILFRK